MCMYCHPLLLCYASWALSSLYQEQVSWPFGLMYCDPNIHQFTESLSLLCHVCLCHLFPHILIAWDGGWLHMPLSSHDQMSWLCNLYLAALAMIIIIPVANYHPVHPWLPFSHCTTTVAPVERNGMFLWVSCILSAFGCLLIVYHNDEQYRYGFLTGKVQPSAVQSLKLSKFEPS